MNGQLITQILRRRLPNASDEEIIELRDTAIRLLGNLVHYRGHGSHEEEDVVRAAMALDLFRVQGGAS